MLQLIGALQIEKCANDPGFSLFFSPQGVTYCGESKASTLTMENMPWHEEVSFLLIDLYISLIVSFENLLLHQNNVF